MKRSMPLGAVILAVAILAGCDSQGSVFSLKSPDVPQKMNPANFVALVDNPLWPMIPGSSWTYEVQTREGKEVITVEVLADKRLVDGVMATVVHDQVVLEGSIIEDTYDWYAQDRDGNVWYVGEESEEIRDGVVVSTAGSWESGVDGALAGIYMFANPEVGAIYYQEFYSGEAEDVGEVLALNQTVTVPSGSYTDCVKTRDTTPLQPDVLEEKYYCPGVGAVLAVDIAGGGIREELVSFSKGE